MRPASGFSHRLPARHAGLGATSLGDREVSHSMIASLALVISPQIVSVLDPLTVIDPYSVLEPSPALPTNPVLEYFPYELMALNKSIIRLQITKENSL